MTDFLQNEMIIRDTTDGPTLISPERFLFYLFIFIFDVYCIITFYRKLLFHIAQATHLLFLSGVALEPTIC